MSSPASPHATLGPPDAADSEFDSERTLRALLASGLGVLPLCAMFTDLGWLTDVWLTMAVVVGPAWLLRQIRPASAGQVWVGIALLVPWLTLRFFPAHAFARLIPLRASWHDVGALLTALHRTAADEVAPVHTTGAIRLTLCAILGLLAALVDLIAVVGRRGALAGVPLLVVYTVSGAVPRQPVSWLLFAVAAGGFLLLLSLDSREDISRWGHHVPRPGGARTRAVLAVSGLRIAAIAIAAAAVIPLVLPSNSGNLLANLFHNGPGGGGFGFGATGGGSIDPFVALRGQLQRTHRQKLFTVTVRPPAGAPSLSRVGVQPFYLRENVLSDFVGNGWIPTEHGPSEPINDTRFEASPGTPYQPRTVSFEADISISGLSANPPVFAVPTNVTGLSGAGWSPQDLLLTGTHVHRGQQFHETVSQPTPTAADFAAATDDFRQMAIWLPQPNVAASVHALVTRLTADKPTPYAKARAINDYFTDPANGFRYSLQTQGDSRDELVDFLRNKLGYCQQYAAAMGVMLRLAGLPARVVLGYTHPVPNAGGSFDVTTDDAHAWVEAYFAGLGWIPFDPTPLAGIGGGAANDLAWAPHPNPSDGTTGIPSTRVTSGVARNGRPASESAGPAVSAGRTAHASATRSLILVAAGALGLLAVLALIPCAVRLWRRRERLRRARCGDPDALWAELSATAADLGYVWARSRTPRQVVTWLDGPSGAAGGSLRTLAAAVERSRYAPPSRATEYRAPGIDASGNLADDPASLTRDLRAVEAGLRTGRAPRTRLRARFWPASLGWPSRWVPQRRH